MPSSTGGAAGAGAAGAMKTGGGVATGAGSTTGAGGLKSRPPSIAVCGESPISMYCRGASAPALLFSAETSQRDGVPYSAEMSVWVMMQPGVDSRSSATLVSTSSVCSRSAPWSRPWPKISQKQVLPSWMPLSSVRCAAATLARRITPSSFSTSMGMAQSRASGVLTAGVASSWSSVWEGVLESSSAERLEALNFSHVTMRPPTEASRFLRHGRTSQRYTRWRPSGPLSASCSLRTMCPCSARSYTCRQPGCRPGKISYWLLPTSGCTICRPNSEIHCLLASM